VEDISKAVYLRHEKYIERDSMVVKRVAEGFSRENYLRDVFTWLPSNIKDIGYVAEDKGAEFALTHKWGDCTELMYAFVALARARGIPARGVAGFVMDQDSGVMRSSSYHNWAEYHDGRRWVIVDPQKKVFDSDYSQYVTYRYFGEGAEQSLSASRFLVVDKRLSVTL
jgi:transglutaminase-like putative cysteine protease